MRGHTQRAVVAFGRFWWDFLIGDTPELFLGVLFVVGAALVLRHDRAVGLVAMVVLTVVFLLGSTYRGRSTSAPPASVEGRAR